MKFRLIIDKKKAEEVVITAHERSPLIEEIQALVERQSGQERLVAYTDDGIKMLSVSSVECITVLDGKTYAIDQMGQKYRLKERLYELESLLPPSFIRINKSALANESRLDRFAVTYSGAVDAVFCCGYREYVSRRCFAQIKRRFEGK
jgi:DNA-binding LytR/AlgR family response regulator